MLPQLHPTVTSEALHLPPPLYTHLPALHFTEVSGTAWQELADFVALPKGTKLAQQVLSLHEAAGPSTFMQLRQQRPLLLFPHSETLHESLVISYSSSKKLR